MFDYLDYAICGMLAFIVMVMVAGYLVWDYVSHALGGG